MTCDLCNADINPYYDISAEVVRMNKELLKVASWSPAASKILLPGRVVLLRNGHFPGNLAILLRNAPVLVRDGMKSDSKAYWAVVLVTPDQKSGEDGELSLCGPELL